MDQPLNTVAAAVPSIGRAQTVLVDGRTFALSDESGDMFGPTHGMVFDDRRHLSVNTVTFDGARAEVLAASTPTPLSSVVVGRLIDGGAPIVVTRRRWVANGLRDDVHLHNTAASPATCVVAITLATDFAHVFDVKAGRRRAAVAMRPDHDGWRLCAPDDDTLCTLVRCEPRPTTVDVGTGALVWELDLAPRGEASITITCEPMEDGVVAGLAFPPGMHPAEAVPIRRLQKWRTEVPTAESIDPRLSMAVDQALADIAALRIIDAGHTERAVVAAGAPWFMTLFGRDSLMTSWMMLPFDPQLAVGVLLSLADLQGTVTDAAAEEQPGKILHELRRHGGGGPFATRQRYYGTVDATPLFVMLAAEAWRWGALDRADVDRLAPAVDRALGWILELGDTDGDGFVDYRRSHPSGLENQGWKDSWDGVTFADGTLPTGPIALAEVQGYVYAALTGAAEMHGSFGLEADVARLRTEAARLRDAFNDRFWDDRGWFALGLDGNGRHIDSVTTNPGHALWTGIADPVLADRHIDRMMGDDMWTGWGLRTLADTMAAYDPLSYHNGSVWPHDTAICAAGAARYGRWDVVDTIVDGALDAAVEFGGRPPELFAGISRIEAPMPVAYPASCSPQAWSSASTLLHIRSMLGLEPGRDRAGPRLDRTDLSSVPDLRLRRVAHSGRRFDIEVRQGRSEVVGQAATDSTTIA